MTALSEAPVMDTLEAVEADLLLEGLHRRWGYDLRGYDRRRIRASLSLLQRARRAASLSALQERVLRDSREADRLVEALSRPRARLLDDIPFWRAFRRRVVPFLRTYPSARLWVPCCGRGEHAFALAVVLEEEGFSGRIEIYATDLAPAIETARRGRLAGAVLGAAAARHAAAGGTRPLREHFPEGIPSPGLRQRIVLGTHSVSTDGPINEFQFVLCRGLLPRFGPALRRRVLGLVRDSLCPLGLVGLDPPATDPGTPGLAPYVREEGLWRRTA